MGEEAKVPAVPDNTVQSEVRPKKRSVTRRIVKGVLWTLGILLVVVCLLAATRNFLVRLLVNELGDDILGVPVTMGRFVSTLSGRVEISNFVITNPRGFQYPNAFELKHLSVRVDPWSLFSDRIVIKSIEVRGMRVNYEQQLERSNIGEILENVKRYAGTSEEEEGVKAKEPERVGEETADQELLIKVIDFKENAVSLSNSMLKTTIEIPMPEIHLENVGEHSSSIAQTVEELLGLILKNVIDSSTRAGKVLFRFSKSTLEQAEQVVKSTGSSWVEGVTNIPGSGKRLLQKIFK